MAPAALDVIWGGAKAPFRYVIVAMAAAEADKVADGIPNVFTAYLIFVLYSQHHSRGFHASLASNYLPTQADINLLAIQPRETTPPEAPELHATFDGTQEVELSENKSNEHKTEQRDPATAVASPKTEEPTAETDPVSVLNGSEEAGAVAKEPTPTPTPITANMESNAIAGGPGPSESIKTSDLAVTHVPDVGETAPEEVKAGLQEVTAGKPAKVVAEKADEAAPVETSALNINATAYGQTGDTAEPSTPSAEAAPEDSVSSPVTGDKRKSGDSVGTNGETGGKKMKIEAGPSVSTTNGGSVPAKKVGRPRKEKKGPAPPVRTSTRKTRSQGPVEP
ncbi:hypothetical protein B0H63DRAFT_445699 [Podospora didyma]|uniref:Uncharacterized protein n=1 Tax=Podospora didyma TaxID=330526 RepID=A0AAE0NXS4_9PEZI|nr:hypothetical protein B0H63DRAFT_445699 [Podospora didyma]